MAEGWKQVWEDIVRAMGIGGSRADHEAPAVDEPKAVGSTAGGAETDLQAKQVEPPAEIADAREELPPEPVAAVPRRRWVGRSIAATGLVLAVLLVLSGRHHWWERLTARRPPAPDVIATFDGGRITIASLESHLRLLVPEETRSQEPSPAMVLQVVEDMVLDELARRWAAKRRPDRDEEFSHTMEHISESLNLESLDAEWHKGEIPVSESEIQEYYTANKERFGNRPLHEVRTEVREHLVSKGEKGFADAYVARLKENASITRRFELLDVPDPAEDDLRLYYDANRGTYRVPRQARVDELRFALAGDEKAATASARDALLRVRSGATFADAGRAIAGAEVLVDTVVAEGTRDVSWDRVVFSSLTTGELSGVFRGGDSLSIVRLKDLLPARTRTMDDVRSEVAAVVRKQAADKWFSDNAGKAVLVLKGKQYTLGQFYREYQELPESVRAEYAGPEGMKRLAEQLIERLLLVQDTDDRMLDTRNEELTEEARLLVRRQMMHQEEVDDKIEVSEDEVRALYDEQRAHMVRPARSRIRYIRIGLGSAADEGKAARERATAAYAKLVPGAFREGADFAAVAREYSEDPETASKGGELPDWIGETDDLLAELELHPLHDAISRLSPNEIGGPFEMGDSIYIVQIVERKDPEPLTFDEAKPRLEERLHRRKHDEKLGKLNADLLKEANFVLYPTVIEDYLEKNVTRARR